MPSTSHQGRRTWVLASVLLVVFGAWIGCRCSTEEPVPLEITEAADSEVPTEPATEAQAAEPVTDEAPPKELSQALATAVALMPEEKRAAAIPAAGDSGDGKRLYQQSCASCHGSDGRGNGPAAAFLDPAPGDLTDPERFHRTTAAEKAWVITEGVKAGSAMPGFKAALSEQQVWSVVAYLETFQAGEEDP